MGFECRAVSRVFSGSAGDVRALADLSFRVDRCEFVCVVGPSGCGKTTLLRLVAGLLRPSSGEIVFGEPPPAHRPRNALVFQEQGLFPWMTVAENIALGLEARGVRRTERLRQARDFAAQVGLHGFADRYPNVLSVGMRQRASIARAFLADPQMLLMDEPLGSVDAQTKRILQEEILRIWSAHRKTVLYVTHDIEEAVLLGDRVLVMSGRPGRILEDLPIPLERPRRLDQERPEIRELRRHIWTHLENEVRRNLAAGP